MRLLLDTHALLWWLDDPDKLSKTVRDLIVDADNQVYISSVTAWEIAIKKSLGKLIAPDNLEAVIDEAHFDPLPITIKHALAVSSLPAHHSDPFDRMLIAQAGLESLTIVTRDRNIPLYGVSSIKA